MAQSGEGGIFPPHVNTAPGAWTEPRIRFRHTYNSVTTLPELVGYPRQNLCVTRMIYVTFQSPKSWPIKLGITAHMVVDGSVT